MRFYEQVVEGRTVISAPIVADPNRQGDRVVRAVDAECWVEAKKYLGYALSAVQECLLDKFYEDRARAARLRVLAA